MKYRLKKPIPGVQAGTELEEINGSGALYLGERCVISSHQMRAMDDQGTTSEWLEVIPREPKIPGQYVPDCPGEPLGNTHVIDLHGDADLVQDLPLRHIKHLAALGLSFETEEECDKWIEWLKARATLLRDTKGFKPNWRNTNQLRCCVGHTVVNGFSVYDTYCCNEGVIYFPDEASARASIKAHPEEWKIYLGVED